MVLMVPSGKPSKISPTSNMTADFAQNKIAINPVMNMRAIWTRTMSW